MQAERGTPVIGVPHATGGAAMVVDNPLLSYGFPGLMVLILLGGLVAVWRQSIRDRDQHAAALRKSTEEAAARQDRHEAKLYELLEAMQELAASQRNRITRGE